MVPEIGHLALILALLLALLLGVLSLAGAWRDHAPWMLMARPLACGQALFVGLSWACLVWSFLQDDFSVRNVAENANSMLPAMYRFTTAWGSHEGSMLLWVLMQSLWTLAVAGFGRHLPLPVRARVLGVMGLLAAGFMLFVLFASNPFLRLFPVPAQGRDLNPLLQDPGMVSHPPLLYMGYVGFSVAFAFAMATLLAGRPDAGWERRARPWTLAAWCFLARAQPYVRCACHGGAGGAGHQVGCARAGDERPGRVAGLRRRRRDHGRRGGDVHDAAPVAPCTRRHRWLPAG
jgi:cytochrome c-type biogenesis protein CcmF